MSETDVKINFAAPPVFRKWPSLNHEPVSATLGAHPYLMHAAIHVEPASQHHLYEIHTAPKQTLVTAVLSSEQVVELVRLREFL